MAIRHRDVFPVGSSPDSIQWDVWNADHEGVAGSITQDQQDALDAANAPTTGNPFATIADVASGGGGGLAIYGDASDGDVVIDGPDYPALAGVDDWAPTTAYVVGDLVKSTGTNVRVYRCVHGGTSGGADPFTDDIPGAQSRRDVTIENVDAGPVGPPTVNRPIWEQTTAVIATVCEGNIYADSLSIEADVICKGWILYALDTLTLDAGITLSADGLDATTHDGADSLMTGGLTAPVFGVGAPGAGHGGGYPSMGAPQLIVAGSGGYGGSGGDGDGAVTFYTAIGYRGIHALPSLLTRTNPVVTGGVYDLAEPQRTSFGGAGGADAGGATILGGGGGEGGSPLSVWGRRLVLRGALTAKGGDGAPGQGADTGGGGGGQGGAIILVYDTLDDTGATYDVSGGQGGAGQGTGTDGGPGTDGAVIAIPNA